MNEVVLFCENSIDGTMIIVAQIDENGRLLILGDEYFRDNEKEYCYVVDRENTKKLSALLKNKQNDSLLALLGKKYDGSNGCERLMEFCREHGVSYHYLEVE